MALPDVRPEVPFRVQLSWTTVDSHNGNPCSCCQPGGSCVIKVLDRPTYDGWIWIEGYQLNAAGDATERRALYVLKNGLRRL
ncbi:hypothetical protein E0H26_17890 [Micromonospora zingiberis]|uniref:Uncharacterized protein n=1 Tax=Micromonospora zingiberis TaxID=2053011 RepID=A0A4V2LWC8_9ACTN|nr:hypothetical protein E0H26_17890 [Micromonospora zingiberis]